MTVRHYLLVLLSTFSTLLISQVPTFLSCRASSDLPLSECSQLEYSKFISLGQSKIRTSMGLIVRDSITVPFSVKRNGKVKVRSATTGVSGKLKALCEGWVRQLEGKVAASDNEKYTAVFVFDIPALNVLDIDEADASPTLLNCTDYNVVAQRSCLEYIFNDKVQDLMLRQYEGYAEYDIYFGPNGKLFAIHPKIPARNAKLNDSLIDRISKIKNFVTMDPVVAREHFSRYYRMHFRYSFFFSSVAQRVYFEREAAEFYASGDTANLVEKMILSGLTLKRYSSFKKHCEKFKERYNLSGKEYLENCFGKHTIDSLIERSAFFDERTDSVLATENVGARPSICVDSDSVYKCTSEYVRHFLEERLKGEYDISLDDQAFSQVDLLDCENRGRIYLVVGRDGTVLKVLPDFFRWSVLLEGRSRYLLNEEQRHYFNLLFIQILSELPAFKSASINGFDCHDSFNVPITLGRSCRD